MIDFKVSREAFLKALRAGRSAVGRDTSRPALAAILLTVDVAQLRLGTTNLDISIFATCPVVSVTTTGQALVDAKKLLEIVSLMTETEIRLKGTANNAVEIVSGKSKFKISGYNPEDFPLVERGFKVPEFLKVSAPAFASMLGKTAFCASTDQTRYSMCGVRLLSDNDSLVMVSTDSHRMAKVEKKFETTLSVPSSGVTVPVKGVSAIQELAESVDDDGFVQVGLSEDTIVVKTDDTAVSVRLITEPFPNYKSVIPKSNTAVVTVNKEAFKSVLRRVSAIAAEGKSSGVQFDLTTNSLAVSATSAQFGEARDEIDCQYTGTPITIRFNAKYVIDGLAAADTDEVRLTFLNDSSPAALFNKDSDDFLYIVMPQRL